MKKTFILIGLGIAAPLFAQASAPPFVVRERNEGYDRLQDAVDAIGGGSGTIIVATGRHRQCAVQTAGRIAFVAARAGAAVFDGVTCEGKAALVLRGDAATVEGLTFQNMRVPDQNGAGIRLEQGDLTVRETLFRNGENGILSGDDPDSEVVIERSTFSGLGFCGNDCAHSLYIGGYGKLTVARSRFERGAGGHYVKSRAPIIEVTDSSFDDSGGRDTNYMIDLPHGARGTIARNMFVQGKGKENYSAMILVAGEGVKQSSVGLVVADNEASLAPGMDKGTAFVADLSGDRLAIGANRFGAGVKRFEQR